MEYCLQFHALFSGLMTLITSFAPCLPQYYLSVYFNTKDPSFTIWW
uniref:Uncharacterized protein n=1 Tax=Arundo donax TaxID=35708 RepID=A0A0A8Y285_ARUDO